MLQFFCHQSPLERPRNFQWREQRIETFAKRSLRFDMQSPGCRAISLSCTDRDSKLDRASPVAREIARVHHCCGVRATGTRGSRPRDRLRFVDSPALTRLRVDCRHGPRRRAATAYHRVPPTRGARHRPTRFDRGACVRKLRAPCRSELHPAARGSQMVRLRGRRCSSQAYRMLREVFRAKRAHRRRTRAAARD